MDTRVLESEMAYFNEHRKELLAKAEGKFVLIKENKDYGFYDDEEQAYKAGVELFGLQPFLIKEVVLKDQIHEIPALYLGLIYASV
jgi:predicted HAD superfamily phosphohydrolase